MTRAEIEAMEEVDTLDDFGTFCDAFTPTLYAYQRKFAVQIADIVARGKKPIVVRLRNGGFSVLAGSL